MPTIPAVASDVQVLDRTSQFNGLYGVVKSLVAATQHNEAMAVVGLRPQGNKPGDDFNDDAQVQRFRYTQLHVLSGGTADQHVDSGNAASSERQKSPQGPWLGDFLNNCDVILAFPPGDINSSKTGDWIDVSKYTGIAVVLVKEQGTAGDDPSIKIDQATGNDGAGSKPLLFSEVAHKIGTDISVVKFWTRLAVTPTGDKDLGVSPDLGSDNKQATILVDLPLTALDRAGGFKWVRLFIDGADVGATQLACGLYILYGRVRSTIPPDAVGTIITP